MNCTTTNGRVNIMGPNLSALFQMKDRIPVSECSNFREAVTGNWYPTLLSNAFFSEENIQILQNAIRAGVYRLSNGKYLIDNQNCDDLKIIMRGVFLQDANNLPNNIPEQIRALNNIVLDYAIPQVYGDAKGYLKFKQDVSTMYMPIERPVQAEATEKTLVYPMWF
jgi:hypothetical protein